jgi:hypothetical protein
MATVSPISLTSQGLTGPLLATIDTLWQEKLAVPQYLDALALKYGDQNLQVMKFILGLGMKKGIPNETFHGWEKGKTAASFSTNADATQNTAGAAIVVAVAAAEVDTNGYSYPRVGDRVTNTTTGQKGLITAKSGSNLTIKPIRTLGGSNPTWGTVTAGTVFMIDNNVRAESTGQPAAAQSFWYRYDTTLEIVKETTKLSGSMKATQPQWLTPFNGFVAEQTWDGEYRILRGQAINFFQGIPSQDLTDADGNPVRTTTGLDYEVSSRGLTYGYGSSLDIADLNTVTTQLLQRFGGNMYVAYLPTPVLTAFSQSVFSSGSGYFQNTNLNAANKKIADMFLGGDVEAVETLALTSTTSTITLPNNVTVSLMNHPLSNDPTSYAANTSSFLQKVGYLIPLRKRKNEKTGDLEASITMLYRTLNGYDRMMNITEDGRASTRQIGEMDWSATYLSSEYGFYFSALEQFAKLNAS